MTILLRIAIVFVAVGALGAQQPRAVTVRVDNDALNFWRAAGERPDEEYTSGVHLAYDLSAAPWWARKIGSTLRACAPGVSPCRARRFEFGQDIYTPRRTQLDSAPPAGSRINAGWLYVGESARVLRDDRLDELTLIIGVTGEPALAQLTQRMAHQWLPRFNRPTDWNRQLGFEPGVIVRYERTRRVGSGAFDLLPRARVEIGNISTALEAGLRARGGLGLRHPWLPGVQRGPVEVVVTAGAAARGVVRDIFLDGNTIRPTGRVGHEPFVYTGECSISVRWEWLSVSYGAVTETRAYTRGPATHAWSSLSASIVMLR